MYKILHKQFFNINLIHKFIVILEQSENHRFEQAKDPAKNSWLKAIPLIFKNITKPAANYLFGSFALHSFAVLRSRMTNPSRFFHYIKNKEIKALIMTLGLISTLANADEWNSTVDDWLCYGTNNATTQISPTDDATMLNNMNVEGDTRYNLLCKFSYNFASNNDKYALNISFPNCQFSSDNQLINISLLKNSSDIIDGSTYQIRFSQDLNSYLTGNEINQDQNAKLSFFSEIISKDIMNLNIPNLGSLNINLKGLHNGIQTPYCSKK